MNLAAALWNVLGRTLLSRLNSAYRNAKSRLLPVAPITALLSTQKIKYTRGGSIILARLGLLLALAKIMPLLKRLPSSRAFSLTISGILRAVWGRCDDSQPGIPTDKLPQKDLAFNIRGKLQIFLKFTLVPGLSAVFVAAGIDDSIALTENGDAYSWGFSSDYRTGQGTTETVDVPTQIQNTALVGKKITFAGCGGQFGVLAGPAMLPNGVTK